MLHSIKSPNDIKDFIDKTNSLHDGYVVGVNIITMVYRK